MITANTEALMRFLLTLELEPKFQQQTSQVYLLYKVGPQEFPLLFRFFSEDTLLQLTLVFPVVLEPTRAAPMARLLHVLNKEVDQPGFCMDEASKLLFYRLIIPLFDRMIDPKLLELYLKPMPRICSQFFPVLTGMNNSSKPFEEVISKK